MYISENIKRLRKEKNITQEKLAEHLNISCQAISKWERDETYPDITLIIPLACYFGVSTDEILGLDIAKNKQKIMDYLSEYNRLSNLGKNKEKFIFIEKAYKEFPNDFNIIDKYMWMLVYDPNCENNWGLPKHIDELSMLCDRVFAECTIDKIKYSALSILSSIYEQQGNREKVIETIERFPEGFYETKGQQYENLYTRGSDEWIEQVHKNIYSLSDNIIVKFRNCAIYSKNPPEERIKQFLKAVDYIKIVYDESDYGFSHYYLCEQYIHIANRYIELKNYDKALEYLDLGLSHGKKYDELPKITKHTSFLVKDYEFKTSEVYSSCEENNVARELAYINDSEFYAPVRDMEWFKTVIEKYQVYSLCNKNY